MFFKNSPHFQILSAHPSHFHLVTVFSFIFFNNPSLFISIHLGTDFYIGCSFKSLPKIDVEVAIVNAPLIGLQNKNTNNTKSQVRFKQLICNL
jgi:hypothetical protein